MAAITICSDFGAQKMKYDSTSTVSPSICHDVMGPDAMILVFWMLNFKPTFSLSSFTFIKRLFSSSSLSAIRVVSSAYLMMNYVLTNGSSFLYHGHWIPFFSCFCFSVLSCHFPLKTLLQVSDKRTKRKLENAFIFFHHYLWAVGLWNLLVPKALKEPFLLPSAIFLVHHIPASATLPIDTHPDAPCLTDGRLSLPFLIRAHQWNLSVIRLFTYMFGLYLSVLSVFPFFLVGILGWFVFPWFLCASLAITTPARESSL